MGQVDDGYGIAAGDEQCIGRRIDLRIIPAAIGTGELEELAAERAGEVKLVKVDVDRAPRLSSRFSVQAVPTLMILDHGEVIARQAGAAPVAVLRRWFDDAMLQRRRAQRKAGEAEEGGGHRDRS